MDQLNDIRLDLDFLVERAKRKLLSLQCKRLAHSDNPLSSLDYIVTTGTNDDIIFKMRKNIPNDCNNTYKMLQKYTLKDFQCYFKVLRLLSQCKE